MRKPAFLTLVLLALAVPTMAQPAAMTLTSQDVAQGARISNAQVYNGCNGDNISPALAWSEAPKGTKSFALTMFDPDAPGGGWWHWIVFDIPPGRHELQQGAGNPERTLLPDGVKQGTTDFGTPGYGGPCPPAGDKPHRYQFTLWALDAADAPFGTDITGPKILPWLHRHTLAKTTLTAKYGR